MTDACDGWISDPTRATDYTCIYGTHTIDLSECFVYGTTFNTSNRASGHAYADPTTGESVTEATSPTEVDLLTARLLDLDAAHGKVSASAGGDRDYAARNVAAQCVALGIESDCETKPIFAPAGDVIEASQHDLDAIQGNPLNAFEPTTPISHIEHRTLTPSREPRWYNATDPCAAGTYDGFAQKL